MPSVLGLALITAPLWITGCGRSETPMLEFDEVVGDPELEAIAKSGKNPREIRAAIKAKLLSRGEPERLRKPEAKKKKKS
jgi:hypothetical protein